jgi:hypothetical protein
MPAGAGTQWVQPLRQASQQPPQAPRWPLWCNGQRISVAEAVFDAAQATVWARQQGFVLEAATVQGAQAWQLQADDPGGTQCDGATAAHTGALWPLAQ